MKNSKHITSPSQGNAPARRQFPGTAPGKTRKAAQNSRREVAGGPPRKRKSAVSSKSEKAKMTALPRKKAEKRSLAAASSAEQSGDRLMLRESSLRKLPPTRAEQAGSRRPGSALRESRIPGENENGKLRMIPLGGMREIGGNMTLYSYGEDLIIVDCGISFPDEQMPGVDALIPDFTYLRRHAREIRGLFLTHGHEDHIGAVAWLLREFNIPVYGGALTMKLVENKMNDRERGGQSQGQGVALDPRLHVVQKGDVVRAGKFSVEFIHVNHSIADAFALAISTPAGRLIHSGDFKVDFTPVQGAPIDLNRIAELGNEGVLALVLESTNVEHPGTTPSEQIVAQSFSELFNEARGRIFVATFSSNVFRIQQIIDAAEAHKRKFCLLGYSMNKVFEAADQLGYLHYHPESHIEVWDVEHYPDDQILIITTGTQGEPMSALSRMAFSEHRQVNIKEGDTVILSSSMIPGNEKSIYRVINELFKIGADVVYEKLQIIHVSGHAYRDELQLMINLVHPKYFIPAHGEYRHLHKNAQLAHSQGISKEHIFLLNNGDILELDQKEGAIRGFVEESAPILVDGSGVGDVDQAVLRERQLLAEDGVISVVMVVDRERNQLAADPEVYALGFIYQADRDRLLNIVKTRIQEEVHKLGRSDKPLARSLRANQFRELLRSVLYAETKRRPVMMISVVEL